MDGHLRTDLCEWMEREEEETDLVLAMGTSLCGMNADRMVETPGAKRLKHGHGLGAVIVGFQRTRLDSVASLRIFAPIDEVMILLAREMDLELKTSMYTMPTPPSDFQFVVPYNPDGSPSKKLRIKLSLQVGDKIKLTAGPGKGFIGAVTRTPSKGDSYSFTVEFPCTREGSPSFGKGRNFYALGAWMIDEACKGKLHLLPVVNV